MPDIKLGAHSHGAGKQSTSCVICSEALCTRFSKKNVIKINRYLLAPYMTNDNKQIDLLMESFYLITQIVKIYSKKSL